MKLVNIEGKDFQSKGRQVNRRTGRLFTDDDWLNFTGARYARWQLDAYLEGRYCGAGRPFYMETFLYFTVNCEFLY